jgi:type IX secretion system PorP/SprF family membrane protein
MKIKYAILTMLLLAVMQITAQQVGMYGHYFYKPMIYNPAFTGTDDGTNVMVVSRSQWTDFRNSPQLNILSADGNFMNEKGGLGLIVVSDKKGLSNRTSGNVNYSYKIKFNDDAHLLFGVSLGIVNQQFNFNNAIVENNTDPTLFANSEQKTTFDGNAGIGFVWKGLQFGAAVPQIIGNRINYVDNTNVRAYYTQTRHYLGTLKYKFYLSKEKGISIAPMGLVRFVPNTPFQYDGNLNFDWKDKFWIGATYKSDYAVGANAGFCIHKQLYVGYSYDFIIGSISKYAGTSHELMVNFKFGKNKKTTPEPIVEEKVKPITKLENEAYVKRMDSLQKQLQQSQEKINELAKKLEQQQQVAPQNTAIQTPTYTENNQNTAAVESNTTKTQEEGVWMVANESKDFINDKNLNPEGSFYVIVGTFTYRDLAIAEAKRYTERGYQANWIYFGPKKYNYVYVAKYLSKAVALKKAKEMQALGIKDAWIQLIIE